MRIRIVLFTVDSLTLSSLLFETNHPYPMSSPYLLSDMLHHSGHSPAQRTDNVSDGYSPETTGSSGVDRRWGVFTFNPGSQLPKFVTS